ncbi:enoyl-[acyl-carrier-protein] reductase FabK [Anaerotignum sp. MSJ-24]|jgi:enoyl-[acyl-carrier protein] reductase II|uniref:enoyl-[acyl-carrier-protein] reductase FabK n=1 Tax=Anaerotignum sp. MSJ-24 TaxID=2841521 RepID=UPI001C10A235|nr:enoyl-[acyl-carrier-protein] reductase FabK [Anaerotignum sp. MSJ-24]MBU5463522.1 enoyl-[acyl-carrier-protein] reductase FabK [Anaerotignum sp. MSJ-24]
MYADICKVLGIKYPIIQGAMAWISDADLVAAVSNAGGLGVLATGHLDGEGCRQEIRRLKEMTDKPYAVNVMLLSPFVEQIVEVICEEKVPIVTTGAGSPGKYMKKFKEAGVKVIPVVPSVAMAKMMVKDGVDALIAEGTESGGHVGKTTTMALVPQVVDAVDVPVIAAGGIADGRGIAAAYMLGASGVQIGTRFLVAKECNVHPNYKAKIIKAKDIDTTTTGNSTGHPVRVIKNKMARAYEALEKKNASAEELEELGRGALKKAVVDGDVDNGSVMSGQIAGLVKKEQTCKEIIEEMYGEFIQIMKNTAELYSK